MKIASTTIESPLGPLTAAFLGEDLTGLWFVGQSRYPAAARDWPHDPGLPAAQGLREWLKAYFAGQDPGPYERLKTAGPPFQEAVWAELKLIPYGQLSTYGQIAKNLAEKTGLNPRASQAVGGAVGRNPISIVVPCHRVIGSRGGLTGYAGGVGRKRALLELEGLAGFLK
ncbi:MAG: methylated-DNA--[protein]-cysteine S-methyltransferase [Deltaproteobacteria bacterium]|jgi:methylated-DNA-[protein]-cysteine S-methyltransferase|nr:methylated-DNA--[protein]-cysteine S-methyltransferase [Deltaproteobacteria bacterium]